MKTKKISRNKKFSDPKNPRFSKKELNPVTILVIILILASLFSLFSNLFQKPQLSPIQGSLTLTSIKSGLIVQQEPTNAFRGEKAGGYSLGGTSYDYRHYEYFDLSSIPPNAVIQTATLTKYSVSIGSSNRIQVKRATESWTENQSYNTLSRYPYTASSGVNTASTGDLVFNVAALVQETVNSGENKGFEFSRYSNDPSKYYYFRNAPAGKQPKLTISYTYEQCGDGILQAPEQCDFNLEFSDTCSSRGLGTGTLACKTDCTFDTSGCSGVCGDGIKNNDEVCDRTDLGGKTCLTQGYASGNLACFPAGHALECTFNTTNCIPFPSCGNGNVDTGEECDGTNLTGKTCADIPGYVSGNLACLANCQFDVTGCTPEPSCGDGVKNGNESCDGTDLAGATCATLGFDSGNLTCFPPGHALECTINQTDCTNCTPLTCSGQGYECGTYDDSCGNTLNCNNCSSGEYCSAGTCYDDSVPCTNNCTSLNYTCGTWSICGNTTNCGSCGSGEVCKSGDCECKPQTCSSLGKQCGTYDDSCGDDLYCGTCSAGYDCENGICIRETSVPTDTGSDDSTSTQDEESSAWIWIIIILAILILLVAIIIYFVYKKKSSPPPRSPMPPRPPFTPGNMQSMQPRILNRNPAFGTQ